MPTRDLSRPIESGMPVYPGTPPVEVERRTTVEADGYATTGISIDSHAGTHVDAPAHMLADGQTLDEFPLETFRFDAVVADLRPLDPREPIDRAALRAAVPEGAADRADLVVCRTGWEGRWGADGYLDHPYLTADAAEWLVARGCHLGVDAPNVDPTPTGEDEADGYPVHRVLFADGRLIVENLRNLGAVPDRFALHAYPLAIPDADASPVRAVAVVD